MVERRGLSVGKDYLAVGQGVEDVAPTEGATDSDEVGVSSISQSSIGAMRIY
jgi:hypothetical protein